MARSPITAKLFADAAEAHSALVKARAANAKAVQNLEEAKNDLAEATTKAEEARVAAQVSGADGKKLKLAEQAARVQNAADERLIRLQEEADTAQAALAGAIAADEVARAAIQGIGGVYYPTEPAVAPAPPAPPITAVAAPAVAMAPAPQTVVIDDRAHRWNALSTVAVVGIVALVTLVLVACFCFGHGSSNDERVIAGMTGIGTKVDDLGKNLGNQISGVGKQVGDTKEVVDKIATDVANLKDCDRCKAKAPVVKPAAKPAQPPASKPAPTAPISSGPCEYCVPKPVAIVRGHAPAFLVGGRRVCSVQVVDNNDPSKQVARLLVDDDGGFIRITKWDEATGKALEVVRTMMPHHVATGPADQDCAEDLRQVEMAWTKVVQSLHLPNDCLPVKVG